MRNETVHERTASRMSERTYSVQVDKAPTIASRKEEMLNWLTRHDVQADPTLTKGALLAIINNIKPRTPKYHVDELAKLHGHEIIRLPPYHCHFNPIELIWAQVKGYVADNNKTFTMREVEKLVVEGMDRVSAEDWRKAVSHVEKELKDASEKKGTLDAATDHIIIRLGDSEDSVSDSESDNVSSNRL